MCSFDQLGSGLAHAVDTLLVAALEDPADFGPTRGLVQEASLRRLPPPVLVLSGAAAGRTQELADLDSHVAARLTWPEQGPSLIRLLQSHIRQG